MNNIQLIGRLTKDVEVKFTQSGTAVGNFTLAVNRNFKNADGERETDFINCVIWRKSAEILAQYTKKGSQIGVDGRIQTRNYENDQGQRIYVTEVVVENFYFLESKKDDNSYQQSQQGYQQANQGSAQPSQTFGQPKQGTDITEDMLPF